MSEDLPTLERPAKAISGGPSGGRNFIAGTPRMKAHGRAKIAAGAGVAVGSSVILSPSIRSPARLLFRRFRLLPEQAHQVVPQLDLGALPLHDDALLDDGKQ